MGKHHGAGNSTGRWYVVSNTCAVSWGDRKYAARYMTKGNLSEGARISDAQ